MVCKRMLLNIQKDLNDCWKTIEKCDKGMVRPGTQTRKSLQKVVEGCKALRKQVILRRSPKNEID